jgi:MATE family multidrug resistance protein
VLFASALKGAGDTKYVMLINFILSIFFLVIPSYLIIFVFGKGLYEAWIAATSYICMAGISFFLRFLAGKWKKIKVIEEQYIKFDE